MKRSRFTLLSALLCAAFLFVGCGKGKNTEIEGVEGPKVTFADGKITTTMLFKNISIDAGATIPIGEKYPNSSFQIAPDFQSGGLLLSLSLSVADWLGNQGAGLDPQALPGGRPLPGVDGGALPAIAVLLPQLRDSVLYVGPEVVGLFVPFKLDLGGAIVTSRFFNSEGNRVGNLSLVGVDANGENSGILVLMDPVLLGIDGEAARLERLKRYYELGYR